MYRYLRAALGGAAVALIVERLIFRADPDGSSTSLPDYDDATLARMVMTEVFRDPHVPKGAINVNVENGVGLLRGEIEEPA
jgi:osmotically-inducible protein OsmY